MSRNTLSNDMDVDLSVDYYVYQLESAPVKAYRSLNGIRVHKKSSEHFYICLGKNDRLNFESAQDAADHVAKLHQDHLKALRMKTVI